MDEKRKKDLQAVAAAVIVSDYCSMRECGESCIFATRCGEDVLPCGLHDNWPAYWSEPGGGYLEQLIKEVTQ